MKLEIRPNGHLRVTIHPAHRLWGIFREGYDSVVKYNLQGKGENPVEHVLRELFHDYDQSYHRELFETAQKGYDQFRRDLPSIALEKVPIVNVYMTGVDVRRICSAIAGYLGEKINVADSRLSEIRHRHFDLRMDDKLDEDQSRKSIEQDDRISKAQQQIFQKGLALVNNYSILFEGADGIEPYLFDARKPPSGNILLQ